MRTRIKAIAPLIACVAMVGTSDGATISVDRSFAGAAVLSPPGGVNDDGGHNSGGLNIGNAVLDDNARAGRLLVTIDDSGDTGAMFTAIVHITGKWTASEVEGYRTSTGDSGRIFFRDNSLTRELTMNIIDITETTATGANASFDGFTQLDVGTSWTVATDQFNVDGTDYDGVSDSLVGTNLVLDALAPSGTVVDHSGTDVIIRGLGMQWTVTPIPEPTALGLMLVGGLIIASRRRWVS